jgi:hypothetical protein
MLDLLCIFYTAVSTCTCTVFCLLYISAFWFVLHPQACILSTFDSGPFQLHQQMYMGDHYASTCYYLFASSKFASCCFAPSSQQFFFPFDIYLPLQIPYSKLSLANPKRLGFGKTTTIYPSRHSSPTRTSSISNAIFVIVCAFYYPCPYLSCAALAISFLAQILTFAVLLIS